MKKRNRFRRFFLEFLEDRRLLAFAASESLSGSADAGFESVNRDEAWFRSLRVSDGEVVFLGTGIHPDELQIDVPTNTAAADTTNTNVVQPGGSSGLNLTGQGYTVGIWEAGGTVLASHQEFGGRVTVVDTPSSTSHATHVAGTIGASGVNATARGMATNVSIRSRNSASDTTEMAADANLFQVSNHSYSVIVGWDTRDTSAVGLALGVADIWYQDRALQSAEDVDFGQYGGAARDLDTVINNHPHILSVWSAGNNRNDSFANTRGDNTYVTFLSSNPGNVSGFTTPGWYLVPNSGPTAAPGSDGNGGTGYDSIPDSEQTAKNNLTVGAVNDVTVDPVTGVVTASFSSYGPVDDGRVKPDIVGNGVNLFSSTNASNTSYGNSSGTSMSSPNVAGSAILLTEHFENLYGVRPSSATLKGTIIHSAYDAGNFGPDYAYGWGLMDTAAAAEFLTSASVDEGGDALYESAYSGNVWTKNITVASGPLKATLVWNDPASSTFSSGLDDSTPMLVNDLDLWITDSASNIYRPWTLNRLAPSTPAVRTSANHVDNVEQVLIDVPAPGTYTIRVGATGGVSNQAFSLLVSGFVSAVTSTVVGRSLFYNRATSTVFGDGTGNPTGSIDSTKQALLAGQLGTFANVSNYSRGLNGLLVDVQGLSTATASDFQFAVSNGVNPFVAATAVPTVTVLPGVGVSGSNRVKIEFTDNAIRNTWLRVTLLANANTGLAANDVFYFGSAVAEMNISNLAGPPVTLRTNAGDTGLVRQNQSPNPNTVGVTNVFDLNKDGRVNATDTGLVRQNQSPTGSIVLFTAPALLSFAPSDSAAQVTMSSIQADEFFIEFGKSRRRRAL